MDEFSPPVESVNIHHGEATWTYRSPHNLLVRTVWMYKSAIMHQAVSQTLQYWLFVVSARCIMINVQLCARMLQLGFNIFCFYERPFIEKMSPAPIQSGSLTFRRLHVSVCTNSVKNSEVVATWVTKFSTRVSHGLALVGDIKKEFR